MGRQRFPVLSKVFHSAVLAHRFEIQPIIGNFLVGPIDERSINTACSSYFPAFKNERRFGTGTSEFTDFSGLNRREHNFSFEELRLFLCR